MHEQLLICFNMLIGALVLTIIAAIGITVANRITQLRRSQRASKPLVPIALDDTTPIEVFMHGRFNSITTSWGMVKQDYLHLLPVAHIAGVANALRLHGAWSGRVGELLIALKIGKGRS